jgi:hypothetical protein
MSSYVLDETEKDRIAVPVQYDISSFGADYDVEGLVNRLNRGDIFIPPFQRGYIWTISEASRFIESLLLGLPVPGIFLAKEPDKKRLLVIDGQQRLRTLQFFFAGYFNPRDDKKTSRVFKLTEVQKRFDGKTYDKLSEPDKKILSDSIIHATIVKQESPKDNDTSIYHIFERLNSSGRKLTAQQIRVAAFHGAFIDLVIRLNDIPEWRKIFGSYSKTLKDQELIIRFLALYFFAEKYKRPMEEFLNLFTKSADKHGQQFYKDCETVFRATIAAVYQSIGQRAFRPQKSLNAAVYDSVMVGVARRLKTSATFDKADLKKAYAGLLIDAKYIPAVSKSTADEANVKDRLQYAEAAFAKVK